MKFDEAVNDILNEEKIKKPLYHVTETRNVSKIKKKGLLGMQPSNWVQAGSGERYGNGEIYAFENVEDALRWALKFDWEVSKGLGSGKVSVVEIKPDGIEWEVDKNDPLGQAAAKGKWLKRTHVVDPKYIGKSIKVTQDIMPLLTSFDKSISPKQVGL